MGEFILIVGTGAMACLLAARLALSGQAVRMLGTWEAGIGAIQARGIRLTTGDGQVQTIRVLATSSLDQVAGAPFALVLVKSWQTARAAEQLKNCLHPQGVALTLQNGLGNREILADSLGAERSAAGMVTIGATLLGPGDVRAGGEGEIVVEASARLEPWLPALYRAGLAVRTDADFTVALWQKLAINAAINPLTALLEVPNGALLASPHARQLIQATVDETVRVARAIGINLDPLRLEEAVWQVARKTAANRSSMLQDVLRGAPTEIEAINGFICRTGSRLGILTPINQTMVHLIKAKISL
ncbi:MAG TPA: 2-dehydropantoate 2-reductase [Anaerolineaceae bacterium]|nr:2-dehydropantoate 2-reductase [Anaerolineaceae bacterium]